MTDACPQVTVTQEWLWEVQLPPVQGSGDLGAWGYLSKTRLAGDKVQGEGVGRGPPLAES